MNNLIVASVLFASAAALWYGQHHSLQQHRAESRALTREFSAAQDSLAKLTDETTRVKASLAGRRDETKSALQELDSAVAEARQEFPSPSFDPAGEGSWPANRPYFYLAKKHLGHIGYQGFRMDQHLSEPAAMLFGMNPAERNAVDRAYHSFRDQINQLQVSHAQRLEPKPGINNDNHREVSYQIPPVTNEMREARAMFAAAAREAIGDTRATLLFDHAQAQLENSFSLMTMGERTNIVTYHADRQSDGSVQHGIKVEIPGVGAVFLPTDFPVEPGTGLWDYRHLFGEEPLIPLPPKSPDSKK